MKRCSTQESTSWVTEQGKKGRKRMEHCSTKWRLKNTVLHKCVPLWSIRWTHISHFLGQFHFIFVCFLTGGKLPYNAILVCAIQQGQSAVIIQISPHSWASFLKRRMYPNIDCSTIYNSQDNSSLCPWYIFTPNVFSVGKINYMITLVIYQIYEHLICNGKRVPKNHFGSLETMCPN